MTKHYTIEEAEELLKRSKSLTKDEAIKAMREGKKVTHRYFSSDEWMTIIPNTNRIILEDNVTIFINDFFADKTAHGWEDGYEII